MACRLRILAKHGVGAAEPPGSFRQDQILRVVERCNEQAGNGGEHEAPCQAAPHRWEDRFDDKADCGQQQHKAPDYRVNDKREAVAFWISSLSCIHRLWMVRKSLHNK